MRRLDRVVRATVRVAAAAAILCAQVAVGAVLRPETAAAATVAAATATDWPMFLHDAGLSSASSEAILTTASAPNLRPAWTFKTGGVIAASATVVGGVVYVGSWDGYEYALNAGTGALIWKRFLGITTAPTCSPPQLGVSSAAAVVGGVVYLGGGDSNWYALDAATGAVKWTVPTGDNSAAGGHYNWSSPLIVGNSAYIGIASLGDCPLVQGQLLRVSLTTHAVLARVSFVPNGQVGGGVWTTPSFDAATNTIYVTTGTLNDPTQTTSESMVALDASTLAIKSHWQIPRSSANADSDWGDSPILFTDGGGRRLVAGINKNGFLYAFDRSNVGAGPVWSLRVAIGGVCPTCGDASVSSMAFAGGVLYAAGGNTTIGGAGVQGAVRAVNPSTGAVLWARALASPVIPALAYDNGMVLAGSGPRLELLNASNGQRLVSYATGATIYSAPTVSGGRVFIGSGDGNIYAFAPTTPAAPPSDASCPAGFGCGAVGGATPAGSEAVTGGAAGSWAIAAGGSGIGGSTDQIRFMAEAATGDVQAHARVAAESVVASGTKSGLMARQSWDANSPFYAVSVAGGNSVTANWRSAFGGAVKSATLSIAGPPRYVQIRRTGDTWAASTSSNGAGYQLVPGSSATVVLPDRILVGPFATSGSSGHAATSTIDSLSIGALGSAPSPPATASPCPSGWSCADVGNPAGAGNQTVSGATWTLTGSGSASGNNAYSDQFHLVWQSFAGNGTISARIGSEVGGSTSAQAGLVFRTNAGDPGAISYGAFVTPAGSIQVVSRSSEGLRTLLIARPASAPIYLRITRYQNIFSAYTSSNGTSWSVIVGSSVTLGAGGAVIGGPALNSGSGALASDTFGSVSVLGSAAPPPSLCPSGWTCQDIGFPTPSAGSQYSIGSSLTVQAGGGDIFGTYDSFRLLSQPLPGNGSFSARLDSQSNTSPWAKAGVMLRSTADPGSPYFAVFATPSNGLAVQWRSTQGGSTGQVGAAATAPVWLQVRRSGSTFTASTSADGVTWHAIAGGTVTLPVTGALLAGLAVTSHNGSSMGTATFDTATLASVIAASPASTYHAITPARLVDTRIGRGLPGRLSAGVPATFAVAGVAGLPSNAVAVTGTATVVAPTSAWALFIGPDPVAGPASSTLNFSAGETEANGLTVALSSTGTLSATYLSNPGNVTDLVFDVTGYFTADMTGATYHAISPARVLDSRVGNGFSGALDAGVPVSFKVAGRDGVPSNAVAVTGNLTVTDQTAPWAVYIGPTAQTAPATSTLNFEAGQVKSTSLTVALDSGGDLFATYLAHAGNTTDLVFDVTGYYTADAGGARFVPISPIRVLDSRVGNGLAGPLGPGAPAGFKVAGRLGIPSSVLSVSGNLTVVDNTGPWAVYLGPASLAAPTTSTLNFPANTIIANGVTVSIGAGGDLFATYLSNPGNTTDLVLDISGWFEP